MASDPEVKSAVERHPRFFSFIKQRFDLAKFSGLTLTLLVLIGLYIISLLAGIAEDIVNSDIVVAADLRVANLLFYFRNLAVLKFFFAVSVLGKTAVVIAAAVLFSIFLWLAGKRIYILAWWLILAGSQGFTFLGKIIFHRPRPTVASYLETSASFPSGHASIAVVLFGFIIYVAWRSAVKKKIRLLITLAGLLIILLIGFSRLYLGVHFVSDVWAGYLVGLLWLAIGISIAEWSEHRQKTVNPGKNYKLAGVILGIVFLSFYSFSSWYYLNQFKPNLTINISQNTVNNPLDIFSSYSVNKYSETLIGTNQEPLSFIIVAASGVDFAADFQKSGWLLADRVSFSSLWHLAKSAILNQDYPTAPMTPDFWNGQVHDFSLEKDTARQSIRQRHHARFWQTNFKTAQGENIYVGTASLDTGIKWLVTHQISPDIDSERELIFQDLQQSGMVASFKKEKFVSPVLGQNFSGDQFFTDGQIYILRLK